MLSRTHLAGAAIGAMALSLVAPQPVEARGFDLTIIHINDHHSHLQPDDGVDLVVGKNKDGSDIESEISTGGFPQVVSKINQLRRKNKNEIVLHAGDAITGTIFYSLFLGDADADLMNQVCFDAFALGNHEFDGGDDGLARFLDRLNPGVTTPSLTKRAGPPSSGPCWTPVLAANVVPAVGTPLAPTADESLIQPYVILDVRGEQVGVIGINVAGKTQISSSPFDTTEFLDEIETAQAQVDALADLGVDKIVLLTHWQYANDLRMAELVDGVDVIVGGDSHTLLGEKFADLGFNPSGPYPTVVETSAGRTVCVAQAFQYADIVGELKVKFDREGEVTSCGGTPHLVIASIDNEAEFITQEANAEADEPLSARELLRANRRILLDTIRLNLRTLRTIRRNKELSYVPADATAQAVLDAYASQVSDLVLQEIGTAPADLCFERVPGQGRGCACEANAGSYNLVTGEVITPAGGDITQFVTEAFQRRATRADVALQNSGGVRIDIPAGAVTIEDAYELLPFANTLFEIEMTGQQIKDTLEEALDNVFNGSTGAMPYGAGLRWDVYLAAPSGNRIQALEVLSQQNEAAGWQPIDLTATYIVAANSFIGNGGDGYFTMGAIPESQKVDTFIDYAQGFIDYVEINLGGEIVKVDPSRYSSQRVRSRAGFACNDSAGNPTITDPNEAPPT